MAPSAPYMYSATASDDSRFPTSTFDPKAITRASWEPKPKRQPQTGPLLSFNTHPDAHDALQQRSEYKDLGSKTKGAIKWVRGLQLFCRLLELNGAVGILVLMILISNVNGATAWIMRITSGIAGLHSLYGLLHHARSATSRTPGSTAAYQLFAGIGDIVFASIYAYGAYTAHQSAEEWSTLLNNKSLVAYLVPAVYYTIIGSGALHVVSFLVSMWLAITFQRICDMPPDMNPLESHLTARPSVYHKRNKSSVTTYSSENEKRLSTAHSSKHPTSWESSFSYPRTVPFMHTRTQSDDTLVNNEPRLNLPQRQYQIASSNTPPRTTASMASSRMSVPRSSRGSYTEIALGDASPSRAQYVQHNHAGANANRSSGNLSGAPARAPKFTETWMPTDSLISRTNHRNREMAAASASRQARGSQSYAAIDQRYNADEDSGSDYGDDENAGDDGVDERNGKHPNPLRSHPMAANEKLAANPSPNGNTSPRPSTRESYHTATSSSSRPTTPWTASKLSAKSALSEISSNERLRQAAAGGSPTRGLTSERSPWTNKPDLRPPPAITGGDFYARSYGELRPATPPVMVGGDRKVSSGNDYHLSTAEQRRRVSGKVAEEGLAGGRFTIGYAS